MPTLPLFLSRVGTENMPALPHLYNRVGTENMPTLPLLLEAVGQFTPDLRCLAIIRSRLLECVNIDVPGRDKF